MHPDTAARLVKAFVPVSGRVLDPFCGSGTVLVEALIQGRRAFGVDLNPLAVFLSRCKTRRRSRAELERLVARARDCARQADERRRQRAGAARRFQAEDMRLFELHVLLELDSLRNALEMTSDESTRLDLSLVLSSILVKLSKKGGDTSAKVVSRRTAPGFPSRLFARKAEELAQRLGGFSSLLPQWANRAFVEQDDATLLRTLPAEKMDAIITSPPYAATYDYIEHHSLRIRWLGLDASALARGELGSRASYRPLDPRKAREQWSQELGRFLGSAARVLENGSPLIMLVADSAVKDVALRADEIIGQVAEDFGFKFAARASQARPHFHGPTAAAFRDRPRLEHAIALRRV
jgi:hypothetical protein